MNWVEQRAFEDDEFRRNGGGVWRNLKLGLASAVESFNKIYTRKAEFTMSDCGHIDENCFRVPQYSTARRKRESYRISNQA